MYLGEIVTTLMPTRNLPGYIVVLPATSHTLDDITIPLAIIEKYSRLAFVWPIVIHYHAQLWVVPRAWAEAFNGARLKNVQIFTAT